MSDIPKITSIPQLQTWIVDNRTHAHPDFDVILDALLKLEETNKLIIASSDKYPELASLIQDVSDTLKKAQLGLESAAILKEPLPNEGNSADNLK